MVKIFCDECLKDCGLIAYDMLTHVLHNPVPCSHTDRGSPKITSDDSHVRFTLCQDCYVKHGLPNVYNAVRVGYPVFREPDKDVAAHDSGTKEWSEIITEFSRNNPADGTFDTDGEAIYCKTYEKAGAVADFLEATYGFTMEVKPADDGFSGYMICPD